MSLEKKGDAMDKLIFSIMRDLGHVGYRPMAADALQLLKSAAEDFMIDVFKKAGESASKRRKSSLVMPADFRVACSHVITAPSSKIPENKQLFAPARHRAPMQRQASKTPTIDAQSGKRKHVNATLDDAATKPEKHLHATPLAAGNSIAATLAAWKSTETPIGIMKPWQYIVDIAAREVDDQDLQEDERAAARAFLNRIKMHGEEEAFLDLPIQDQELYAACCIGQLAAYESWQQTCKSDSQMSDWHLLTGNAKNTFVPLNPVLFLHGFEQYRDLLHLPNADTLFQRLLTN